MYSREAGLSELRYAYPVYVSDAGVIELEQTTQNGRLDVLETAPAGMRALHKYVGFSMDDTVAANVRLWPKADTRGRFLGPKFGDSAVLGCLSVRLRPKADINITRSRTGFGLNLAAAIAIAR